MLLLPIYSLPVPMSIPQQPAQGSPDTERCAKGAHIICCVQVLRGGCKHTVPEGVTCAKPLKHISHLKILSPQQKNMLGITVAALVRPISGNLV